MSITAAGHRRGMVGATCAGLADSSSATEGVAEDKSVAIVCSLPKYGTLAAKKLFAEGKFYPSCVALDRSRGIGGTLQFRPNRRHLAAVLAKPSVVAFRRRGSHRQAVDCPSHWTPLPATPCLWRSS